MAIPEKSDLYVADEKPLTVVKEPTIPGGYFIKARKIKDSDIAHCAPVIREVWDWLLMECNHKPYNGINRGQCVRRIADIQDGLHWYVGYRKMTYSKTQCEGALEHLRKTQMITTAKTTRGLIITICNYEFYQNPKNYEDNNEGNKKTTRRQQHPDTIYKNDKNDKNEMLVAGADAPTNKTFKQWDDKEFITEIGRFKDHFHKDMLNSFYKYWSEKSASGKMKFQLERTWETKKRLENWQRIDESKKK